MDLKFDPDQQHQTDAVKAVADLFEGMPPADAGATLTLSGDGGPLAVPNRLTIAPADLLANLRAVQQRGGVRPDDRLHTLPGTTETADGAPADPFYNFTVEMETGTGKTYVYLRTALELHRRHGLRKFVVVVPGRAVREGVLKTLDATEKHFDALFGNPPVRWSRYRSDSLTQVRQFALSDGVEFLVMTLDSFNKAGNVLLNNNDKLPGVDLPIHLIQAARPVLILDEPQNMESGGSKAALARLCPVAALRYSATHKAPYNVVHRLTPADAYRAGLVKKIEVAGIVQEHDESRPFVRVDGIEAGKRAVKAKLTLHKRQASGAVKEGKATVKPGDDLEGKAKRREYAGFVVREIDVVRQAVTFETPGGATVELTVGQERGEDRAAIFETQIRETIRTHFTKQKRLRADGIKVLSLFFIDAVKNYDSAAAKAAGSEPIIRRMFDRIFKEEAQAFPEWRDVDPADVQAAYFASKKRKGGGRVLEDSTTGEAAKDAAAYDLILRDKESLLTFPVPDDPPETADRRRRAFLFSHSALREGWDNPNVFQVCTLNATGSADRKRQEVGRGVRLAVDQSGERVRDDRVNVLTVVANESYARYVETYQSEIAEEYRAEIEARYGKCVEKLTDDERRAIEEEYGDGILPPPPKPAREEKAKLRKAVALSDDFRALWERIAPRTRYRVAVDTAEVLKQAGAAVARISTEPPRTVVEVGVMNADDGRFEGLAKSARRTGVDLRDREPLPDVVGVMADLLEHANPPVRLTRRTLRELVAGLPDADPLLTNPHDWAVQAVAAVREVLADHLIDGITYTRIAGDGETAWYAMERLLGEQAVKLFSRLIYDSNDADAKSVYDRVGCDSDVEVKFARDLDARDDVRCYVKLPGWFRVPTPVGEYNPDWAVVMGPPDGTADRLYLVAETKSDTAKGKLRPDEYRKIRCGAAHFGSEQPELARDGALKGVDFRLVTNAADLPA